MEPVSHATGAWSLSALHGNANGKRYIAPGRSSPVWMELRVRDSAPALLEN